MAYPNLMFVSDIPSNRIESFVYEDIKLNSMLNEETVGQMLIPCAKEDISARQEMFRHLSEKSFRKHITELSALMDTVYELALRYEDARCDNEKNVLYINLCKAICDFISCVCSGSGEGLLYTRFSEHFRKRCEMSIYQRVVQDLQTIFPELEKISLTKYNIIADELHLSSKCVEPYMDRLIRDAQLLGLNEVTTPVMEEKLLSASVIDATAKLYPEIFAKFADFYERNKNFFEKEILIYHSQLGFYLDICALLDRVINAGIPVCYPKFSEEKKIDISNAYDITLLTKGEAHIIPNDIYFDKNEPFFYLTGANGGGKTTFLRTVGVSVLLFLNGCPIPADRAEIYPIHNVYTHFPRDERFDNAGRNAEEHARVVRILEQTDGCSLILLNETYSTTNEEKARAQTSALAEKLYASGEFGVYVTHMHNMGETEIPFLNVIIDRSDSNRRTYKVAKQKSVYSSYAYDILAKYSLTKEQLDERFANVNVSEESR